MGEKTPFAAFILKIVVKVGISYFLKGVDQI